MYKLFDIMKKKMRMIMKEELLKGLSEEQIAKLKECKNQEEILAIAKEEGIELSDEQLEAVSGGACGDETCECGNRLTNGRCNYIESGRIRKYYCAKCGKFWKEVNL